MVNSKEFSKRLEKVIEYFGETASSFAEKVGVQRSSISHILSGRNKPSLDFVMKILSAYPEVELYWLLNGKGVFPQEKSNNQAVDPTSIIMKAKTAMKSASNSSNSEIDRIVIFYKDGTFKNFEQT